MKYYAAWIMPQPGGQDEDGENGMYYTVRLGDCLGILRSDITAMVHCGAYCVVFDSIYNKGKRIKKI